MTEFSENSIPPQSSETTPNHAARAEPGSDPPKRSQFWHFGATAFLGFLILLSLVELFIKPGAFFRMLTPAPQHSKTKAAVAGQEKEFDPTDLDTVSYTGSISPLGGSDQKELALKLQFLSGRVEALSEREERIRQRANSLGRPDIRESLWRKIMSGSIKDQDLLRGWCEDAGDVSAGDVFEGFAQAFAGMAFAGPLDTVKGRIVCGTASGFDAAYLASLENWVQTRSAALDEWEKRLNSIAAKLKSEGVL